MEFEITTTQDDYLKFSKFVQRDVRRNAEHVRLVNLCILIVAVFVTIAFMYYTSGFRAYLSMLFGMGLGLVLIVAHGLSIRRAMLPRGKGFVHGPRHYVTSSEGIHMTVENAESKVTWRGILRVVETRDHFYLFMDTTAACIIPRDQVDVPVLTAELKKYCPNYDVV